MCIITVRTVPVQLQINYETRISKCYWLLEPHGMLSFNRNVLMLFAGKKYIFCILRISSMICQKIS